MENDQNLVVTKREMIVLYHSNYITPKFPDLAIFPKSAKVDHIKVDIILYDYFGNLC